MDSSLVKDLKRVFSQAPINRFRGEEMQFTRGKEKMSSHCNIFTAIFENDCSK
jgi:hypothetical protein